MIASRAAAVRDFLARTGHRDWTVEPLPGDASFRCYARLIAADGRRAMLMDAPPPQEDVRPFLQVAALLHGLGLSAPRIFEADAGLGCLILEDLGARTYTRAIAAGADEPQLYRLAAEVLAEIHERFDVASPHALPAYDAPRLLAEAALLVDWYLPAETGHATPAALRAEYLSLWAEVLPLAHAVPDTLVLRDYHIDNLMLLEGRSGVQACGLLDFQDAVIGPLAYDLVSLLEDARRDVDPAVAAGVRHHYLAARGRAIDAPGLDLSMAVLGAQRHAKVLGIFCRLAVRDGKPVYLRHLPRVRALLARSLAHPALAPLEAWVVRHVPAPARSMAAASPPIAGAA